MTYKGDQHGPLAHIVRSAQKLLSDYEINDLTRSAQELLAGHFGIGVTLRNLKERNRARKILKARHGQFINYYGRWIKEDF